MSSPVSVNVQIVNLGLFAKAAMDCGCKVKEHETAGVVDKLTVDMPMGSYNKATITMQRDAPAKVDLDNMREAWFNKNLLARYNMYQVRDNWENTGQYVFNDNWLQSRQDGTLELNCERMI